MHPKPTSISTSSENKLAEALLKITKLKKQTSPPPQNEKLWKVHHSPHTHSLICTLTEALSITSEKAQNKEKVRDYTIQYTTLVLKGRQAELKIHYEGEKMLGFFSEYTYWTILKSFFFSPFFLMLSC